MKFRPLLSIVSALIAGVAQAQAPGDIARGNMHFDAKEMDANGDGMISKEEFSRYGETMWQRMNRAANVSVPVTTAAQDFSRGNVRFDAKAMDADGDGNITKDEFMKYGESKFDSMTKNKQGMMSVTEAAQAFARGNMPPK